MVEAVLARAAIDCLLILVKFKFGVLGSEEDGLSLWGEQRSILHEDAVFWVIGQEVITSLWGNPSQAVRAE